MEIDSLHDDVVVQRITQDKRKHTIVNTWTGIHYPRGNVDRNKTQFVLFG